MFTLAMLVLVMQIAAPVRTIEGRVIDPSGAPIGGASVRPSAASAGGREAISATDGTFHLPGLPNGPVILVVSAPGFAERILVMRPSQADATILLRPRGITESVTVSANPEGLRVMTPASATVFDHEALAGSAAWTLDDQLRAVPGFSLFRRSSSRVANPTTQGVTLRGLAASGASRTLVLADGIPLNDPFGGWIYWDRLPAASIDRVEVARGGSSDLHGSDALGGAIRIDTSASQHARVWADAGSDETVRVSGYGGRAFRAWQLFGAAEAFTTGGFVIVGPESRGPIDVPASSDHASAYGGAGTVVGPVRHEVRGSYFDEDRGNGTPFQTNATIVRQLSAQSSGEAAGGQWMARAFGQSQDYDQTFSAVAADRETERPTSLQHVDTRSFGGSFEWLRAGTRRAWLVNGNYRLVDADLFSGAALGNAPLALTAARQQAGGLIVQATFNPSDRWTIGAGARGELWRSEQREIGGAETVGGVFPRASVAWRASETLSLRAAVHDAYRTPTINELFRPFRVGNAVTLANPALLSEEAIGFEGSALVRRGLAAARITGFWTRLNDAIVNVTLQSSPTELVRERQNAGTIRATGLELEADVRVARHLALTGAGAYIDSVFVEGAGLDGLRVPQVPRWQASAGLIATWTQTSASVDWRFTGQQFDDDRNQFSLESSNVVNGRVGWRPRRTVEIFAAVENAFDQEQDVGRTPLRTIGLPRTARVGIRWSSR
jgi:outer membrane receptor protein involved in Fe transport